MKALIILALLATTAHCFVIQNIQWKVSSFFPKEKSVTEGCDFCHGYECPEYKTLNSSGNFEIRIYNETNWAHSSSEGYMYATSILRPYYSLIFYLAGYNQEKTILNMTLPVLNKFSHVGKYRMLTDVYFYMPENYKPLPKPLDKNIKFTTIPNTKFYVRSFPGYIFTFYQIQKQRDMLIKDLKKAGHTFNRNNTFFASYDKQTIFRRHHNEVWVGAE